MLTLSSCGGNKGIFTSGEKEREAKEGGKTLSQKDSMELRATLIEANKEKMIGEPERAQQAFERALEIDPGVASAHYEVARILKEKEERSDALERAKKAVELDAENTWYKKLLADLYMEYGSYDEAASVFKEIRENDDGEIEMAFRHADALVRAGRYEEAISIYDELETRMGLRPKVVLQKQRLYHRIDEVEKAVEEMDKLISAYPGEPEYYGIKAELLQEMDESEQALETYEELLEIDPENGMAHLSLSRFHREQGDEEKALDHLEEAYKSQSLDIDRKVQVLLNYFSMSERDEELKDEAYQLLDILIQAHPQEAKAFSVYGDFLFRDGKDREARKMFKKAVTFEPDKFPIWEQILAIDQKKGMSDSLLQDSREAKEYFPNQPRVHLFEGQALMDLERYEEAAEALEYGKDLVVDDKELEHRFLTRLGEAYHRTGEHAASDRAFEAALDIRDEDPFLLNNYAYYLSTRGDSLDKAARMSKKANEMEPGRASFLDTYGWILYQKGEHEEARDQLKKALQRGGDQSGTILEHYGDALFRTGEKEKALEYWKKARSAGGGSDELERKIREKELPTP